MLSGCTSSTDRLTSEMLPGPVPPGATYVDVPATAPPAPDGTITLSNGDSIQLASLSKNRPVVVIFFEPWCEQCAERQEDINDLAEEFDDAVTFVSVAQAASVDEVSAYAREHEVDYLIGTDTSGDLWESYGVVEAPFTVMIGEGSTLLRGWRGILDDLDGAIGAILVSEMPLRE